MLHPPTTRRERILAYGAPGAGKSSIWLAIAEWIYKSKSDSRVWVVDTDMAWDAMRPDDGHLDSIVEAFPIYSYDEYRPAINKIKENASSADWFVIDRADVLWEAAQEGWSAAVEGKDIDEFFLMHQAQGTSPGGDYGANWVQIKRMYRAMGVDLITRFRGHVLCVAAAEQAREKKGQFGDDADVFAKYSNIGYKPAGEKKLAHLFHTEIYMVESPSGYRMSTLKERRAWSSSGRDVMRGQKVTPDFVMAYLIGIAGWQLSDARVPD
jgi:hypothetical protein